MPKITVSDTSCLILFYKIGELELLKKLFGRIYITEAVFQEYNQKKQSWIKIKSPSSNIDKGLAGFLDPGEATSIALALEHKESLLIIDEIKGRKAAKNLNISITGSLGVLLTAKKKGYIKTVKPLLEKIQKTNFRISEELVNRVLNLAGEI